MRIRIRTCDLRIRMRIREAQKYTDATNPDPKPSFLGVVPLTTTGNKTTHHINILFEY
jgi:hypothetical protein